jgi:dTDP-4-dehydrorhamnose reductase
MSRVLLTGSTGRVGSVLLRTVPPTIELLAPDRQALDLTDAAAVQAYVREVRPSAIINAAAYTAVDQAETDRAQALAVNADAPAHLAHAAADVGASMLHLSTDYVFSGDAGTPWHPDAPVAPKNVYGQSKVLGESAVRDALGPRATIIRTSWVYDATGRNFVNSVLQQMRAGSPLRVVVDQVGVPTSAPSLAAAVWSCLDGGRGAGRTVHWTDAGTASWFDLAVAVQEEALLRGLIRSEVPIVPVRTCDYPVAAVRPAYSVLDTHSSADAFDITPSHWRVSLRRVLDRMAHV